MNDTAEVVDLDGPRRLEIHRVVLSWHVANASPLERPAYGGGTYTFLPETLIAIYDWNPLDNLWRISRFIIRGRRFFANGLGLRHKRAQTTYGPGDLRLAPNWARGTVQRNRPRRNGGPACD